MGGDFPGLFPIPWGAAEDREVHPRGEKSLEIEPEFKEQVLRQTILQMGKFEIQKTETLDQVTPSHEQKSENVFSAKMGVQVRTVHARAVAEAQH